MRIWRQGFRIAVLTLSVLPNIAQAKSLKTYINPIDIPYKYNFEQVNEGISYRTGADPVIVNHKGEYYLFETLVDGWFHSKDLVKWQYIKPENWPMQGIVAPAILSDGDRLIIMASRAMPREILQTKAPNLGKIEHLTRLSPWLPTAAPEGKEENLPENMVQPGPWDPDLFKDTDGKTYLYWGSSNFYPLYGLEVDINKGFEYKGTPNRLLKLEPEKHGWERFGQDHSDEIKPFMEGAHLTKWGGKYYLQYGAPGTEYNAYANGVYVSDRPLVGFKYAPYNPISYKPGGFVEGAGHGSTFKDNYGNYWNTGTPWIGLNWTFERRIAMFPAKFYDDGQMAVSTRFGDFPHFVPKSKVTNPDELFTGWMLLSYKSNVASSSETDGHAANLVTDENPRTYWLAKSNRAGENLTLDLGAVKNIRALQVNFADHNSQTFADSPKIYTEFDVLASVDGKKYFKIASTNNEKIDRPNAYFELKTPVKARFIKYVHKYIGTPNLAISDIRVFGNYGVKPPETPKNFEVKRDKDERNAFVTWEKTMGAVGYNILWGIKPDRLTLNYQIFDDEPNRKEIRALNVGVPYYFAIESFDEFGVSKLSPTVFVP